MCFLDEIEVSLKFDLELFNLDWEKIDLQSLPFKGGHVSDLPKSCENFKIRIVIFETQYDSVTSQIIYGYMMPKYKSEDGMDLFTINIAPVKDIGTHILDAFRNAE